MNNNVINTFSFNLLIILFGTMFHMEIDLSWILYGMENNYIVDQNVQSQPS